MSSLLATILAASEAATHDKSETPFFVVGGAFAAFGVLSGILGIVRPNMSTGFANALMGVCVVLMAGTMVAAIAVS